MTTLEATVDKTGTVHLLHPVSLPAARRAVVTIFGETESNRVCETALLSERSLSTDWDRPEEDAAWAHLQEAQ